jgi:glycerophosphoryl diester phosphodiesterase
MRWVAGLLLALAGAAFFDARQVFPPYTRPTLIAHRGASACAPEHTLAAYRLALEQGADFVEPDLQITKDGVLVCLHDATLERTTDVRRVFPGRARLVNGRKTWPVVDFTIEEVQRLDAGSWMSPKFAGERIPTLQKMIELVRGKAGIFPETKLPESYEKLGWSMEKRLMNTLARNGLDRPGADSKTPVVIQSFSAESLKVLRRKYGCRLPLVLLVKSGPDAARRLSPQGLKETREFADGIAPNKLIIMGRPALVEEAHALGMSVTAWTFRSKERSRFANVREEMAYYLRELHVDALFTDNPDQFPRD